MKRLLVAMDPSDGSTYALARAIELARPLGAKIRLLAVITTPPLVPAPPVGAAYLDPTALLAEAEATLRTHEREIPPELRDGVVVKLGAVSETVCAVARSYGADLVVIGTHRHGLLARMLGTIAATIVNHIDRPIMVVKPLPAAVETMLGDQVEVRASTLLRRDHLRLETIYEDLLAAYRSGEWEQVRTQWNVFEPALRAHIDLEEREIFPSLRLHDPIETDALLAEHAELRRMLSSLGIAVDLHAVPERDAEELVARLRAHGAREKEVLYPWMDMNLTAAQNRTVAPAA